MSAKVAHPKVSPATSTTRASTEPARPTHWVHGEHPERTKPRFGEEPPPLSGEHRITPERLDR